MSRQPGSTRERQYLLGEASEEDCSAIETEYFQREEALDHVASIEDDLIEDYLAGRLAADDRRRFMRAYLAIPHRRRRVDTIRRLIAVASKSPGDVAISRLSIPRAVSPLQWFAAAATLALVAAGSLWLLTPAGTERVPAAGNQSVASSPGATSPSPAPPRIMAVSISPVTVRSVTGSSTVIVASDVDVVALGLEGGGDVQPLLNGRGSLRTVSGKDIWQGPAVVEKLSPGMIARLDVPAVLLTADDYVITLFEITKGGVEREHARYFLSVRAR